MESELRAAMNVYRDITIKLIQELEKENYDALELLLTERQAQIDKVDKFQYSKELFSRICNELQILSLQQVLTRLMNTKRAEVKAELNDFNKGKNANISYRNREKIDSLYFNKKV